MSNANNNSAFQRRFFEVCLCAGIDYTMQIDPDHIKRCKWVDARLHALDMEQFEWKNTLNILKQFGFGVAPLRAFDTLAPAAAPEPIEPEPESLDEAGWLAAEVDEVEAWLKEEARAKKQASQQITPLMPKEWLGLINIEMEQAAQTPISERASTEDEEFYLANDAAYWHESSEETDPRDQWLN